jgi:hypothetical protein
MTDSNIQPPNTGAGIPDSVVPGTDVTYTTPAGLYPETTDPNQDIVITTGTAADTYTVDPNSPPYDSTGDYAGAVDFHVDNMTSAPDPRIDHVLEHLHNLEAKIDQIICDCNHHKEPPTYEGHVVLHATQQPPV